MDKLKGKIKKLKLLIPITVLFLMSLLAGCQSSKVQEPKVGTVPIPVYQLPELQNKHPQADHSSNVQKSLQKWLDKPTP